MAFNNFWKKKPVRLDMDVPRYSVHRTNPGRAALTKIRTNHFSPINNNGIFGKGQNDSQASSETYAPNDYTDSESLKSETVSDEETRGRILQAKNSDARKLKWLTSNLENTKLLTALRSGAINPNIHPTHHNFRPRLRNKEVRVASHDFVHRNPNHPLPLPQPPPTPPTSTNTTIVTLGPTRLLPRKTVLDFGRDAKTLSTQARSDLLTSRMKTEGWLGGGLGGVWTMERKIVA
jgi:hypothetical protein